MPEPTKPLDNTPTAQDLTTALALAQQILPVIPWLELFKQLLTMGLAAFLDWLSREQKKRAAGK